MGAAVGLRAALAGLPAIDHHAHVLAEPGHEPPLARVLTESGDPAQLDHLRHHPSYVRAVRELCVVAGVTPGDEAALAAERERRGADAWRRGLLAACGFSAVLVDDGFCFPGAGRMEDLAALVDCPVQRVVRVESVAESVAVCGAFGEAQERFRTMLRADLDAGAVALKTIAAYRGGLDLPAVERHTAATAFDAWRRRGTTRLDDPALVSFFLDEAIDVIRPQPVPLQVHTGLGDADLDLRRADPLLLRPLIERTGPAVPIVLLHCYPFVAHASYLAGMYANVHLDLSLAMTLVTHRGPDLVLEALGQAPASKLLFATDASRLAEGYLLGARWWRDSLARALGALVDDGHLSGQTALAWAALILSDNASRLYQF